MDDWGIPDNEQTDAFFEPEDEFEGSQAYEHFRFVADKKQTPIRIDKFLTDRLILAKSSIYLLGAVWCIRS